MRMYDIIKKKRDSEILTNEEIFYFVRSLSSGEAEDYQITALLMAIYLNGINEAETVALTKAMIKSGDTIDLSDIKGIKVDKHSTGGVGDTTTLVLAPLVSACGVPVAKMSGRGLGHTGGTLDKLESIPNFRIDLSPLEFRKNVNDIGVSVIGQTKNICPADKKLYALRDVTATVEQYGLIASSIMSKKLAAGSDAIVLDIKTGNGAFMKNQSEAKKLAKEMIAISKSMGKKITAILTDMSQPLGYAIGNSLEVIEAIETLNNRGPEDLTVLCKEFASEMVFYGLEKDGISRQEARILVEETLKSGKALEKFKDMIKAQGGNEKVVEDYSLFKQAKYRKIVKSNKSGYITEFCSEKIGIMASNLGAGRKKKEDSIDYSAGIILKKKIGDYIEKDEELSVLFSDDETFIKNAAEEFLSLVVIGSEKPALNNIIIDKIF